MIGSHMTAAARASRPARFRVPGRLGAGMVIAAGLLLVLAATAGPLPAPAGDPGAKLMIRLPDAVRALVLGLLALSAVILLSPAAARRPTERPAGGPRGRLRRRLRGRPRSSRCLSAPAAGVAWYLVWSHGPATRVSPIEQAFAAIAGLLDFLAQADKPPTSIPSPSTRRSRRSCCAAHARRLRADGPGRAGRTAGDVVGRARRRAGRAARHPEVSPRPRRSARRARCAAGDHPRPTAASSARWRPRAPRARRGRRRPSSCGRRSPGCRCRPPPVERLTALFELARFSAARWARRRATPRAIAWTRSPPRSPEAARRAR